MSGKLAIHTHIHHSHFSSFQNGLKHPCTSASFYFKNKILEGCHEIQKCFGFQLLGSFSQNVHFWCCNIFSCLALQLIFSSGSLNIYDSCFWRSIFLPCNRCYYDWESAFFMFPWQPLLKKSISSAQVCNLSIQTIPHKIGVKKIDYSKDVSSTLLESAQTLVIG